jgi:phage-related holin
METVTQLAVKGLTLFLAFIAPIQTILLASLSLIFADTITGIWASLKEGRKITSHKLRRTILKSCAYMVSIVVAHVIESFMLEGIPVVKTIGGLIAITEGKSIFENLHRVTGIDFWKALIDKLQGSSIKLPEDKPK